MRRMYSEEQLKKLIEEYGMTEEEVEAIVGEATTGKFVKIIPAPSSTTLTEEQYNDIINGVFIEGTDMNYKCKKCGCEIVPTYKEALNAMHMGTTRYLKCPKCKKRTWCKKNIKK